MFILFVCESYSKYSEKEYKYRNHINLASLGSTTFLRRGNTVLVHKNKKYVDGCFILHETYHFLFLGN